MLSDLSSLGDRFGRASDDWPNLQAHLIVWPENEPVPDDLPGIDLRGHDCLFYPQSDSKRFHFEAVLTGGADCDTPAYRYRSGQAGMLLMRWNFGRFGRSPHEVDDPDALMGMEQRFKTLATNGAQILREVGLDIGLSERTLTWKGCTRWLLAVFETLDLEPQRGDCYEVRTIGDVFLASAQAIARWLKGGPAVDANAMMAPRDLARVLQVNQDALEKRLSRWRERNKGSAKYVENSNPGSQEPMFLYRFSLAKREAKSMKRRKAAEH